MRYLIYIFLFCSAILPLSAQNFAELSQSEIIDLVNKNIAEKEEAEHPKFLLQVANQIIRKYPNLGINYANQALSIAEKYNDKVIVADINYLLGSQYSSMASYDQSLKCYFVSLKIAQDLADVNQIANAYNGVAGVFFYTNQMDKVREYYLLALENFETIQDERGKAFIFNNLGEIDYYYGDYKAALQRYLDAHAISEALDDDYLRVVTLHNVGRTYRQLGNYLEGIEYLNNALVLDKKDNNIEGIAFDRYELGLIFFELEEYQQAMVQLQRSLELALSIDLKQVVIDSYKALAELNEKLGFYQKAVEYLEKYSLVKDEVFNDKNLREIAELQSKYEMEKREEDIKLLKIGKEIQQLSLVERQYYTLIVAVVLIILIVIILSIFKRIQMKNKTKLEEENIRAAISTKNKELSDINQKLLLSETELKKLSATKDKFFSIISHDLKSPLNSLSGLLNVMIRYSHTLSKEEFMALTKKLDDSVGNVTNLLDNLLHWSRSQMGSMEFQPEEFDINKDIVETVEVLKIAAEAKKIDLTTSSTDTLPCFGDRNMIRFAIRNVLSNAIKFTLKGGKIWVESELVGSQIKVSIRDTGIGMKEEQVKRLFDTHAHFSTPGTDNEKGTGLGLILCKEFVDLNSGSLKVESTINKGSVFTFYFPAALSSSSKSATKEKVSQ